MKKIKLQFVIIIITIIFISITGCINSPNSKSIETPQTVPPPPPWTIPPTINPPNNFTVPSATLNPESLPTATPIIIPIDIDK